MMTMMAVSLLFFNCLKGFVDKLLSYYWIGLWNNNELLQVDRCTIVGDCLGPTFTSEIKDTRRPKNIATNRRYECKKTSQSPSSQLRFDWTSFDVHADLLNVCTSTSTIVLYPWLAHGGTDADTTASLLSDRNCINTWWTSHQIAKDKKKFHLWESNNHNCTNSLLILSDWLGEKSYNFVGVERRKLWNKSVIESVPSTYWLENDSAKHVVVCLCTHVYLCAT